jgi:hypothetical protein
LKQGVPFDGKMIVMTTSEYLLEGIEAGKIGFSKKKPEDIIYSLRTE